MAPGQCDGCGNSASSFQCPLCQAEAATDRGFFCSQECFARNWLTHRDTLHKSGVVRERQKPAAPVSRKRSSGDSAPPKAKVRSKAEAAAQKRRVDPAHEWAEPWLPLPSVGAVEPSLPCGGPVPRAIVFAAAGTDARVAFWSAAAAAAHFIAREIAHDTAALEPHGRCPLRVLLVAKDPIAAHAAAWALRCAGLAGTMKLVLPGAPVDPSAHFASGQLRIVVTTRCAVGVSAAAWLPGANGLLVTLPGVVDAADLQAVHTRAVFFVGCAGREACDDGDNDAWVKLEEEEEKEKEKEEKEKKRCVTPLREAPAALRSAKEIMDNNENEKNTYDNDVSTSLMRGDLPGAVQHLIRVYSTQRGDFEGLLVRTLLSARGAASIAHAHHTLAYVTRQLVDHSARFDGPQGGTLKEMALRAASKVVRRLQPIISEPHHTTKTKGGNNNKSNDSKDKSAIEEPTPMERERFFNYYDALPNLQLQATLCHLQPHCPPSVTDALASAWAVRRIVPGPTALRRADQRRADAVHRIQSRYGAKLGPLTGEYLVILMHILYDTVANYSLAIEEVERRTLWSMTLANEAGPLRQFLSNCFLLHETKDDGGKGKASGKKKSLSSRHVEHRQTRAEQLRALHPVRTAAVEEAMTLPWVSLPLTGRREREVAKLQKQAVEEILMAMPRMPKPMYVGEVGNLIGKWFRFNTRFEGVLGPNLMEFLLQHPEHFTLVGNIVTRRVAGVSEPVKMRFDDDSGDENDNDSDSDTERKSRLRKASDRTLLTGANGKKNANAEKDLPARARKKALVKAFNQARFNRNYKPIDPTAKVPGYVKRGPRKIKGRGKKANKRNTKRG